MEQEDDCSGHVYDVLIVGMGAAGVEVSAALRHAGVNNFLALERHTVGASFAQWPEEMRFIAPSFPTNSVGMLDINAVAIGTSPAFGLQVEHPTGPQFAQHLCDVVDALDLPVLEHIDVTKVAKKDGLFRIDTNAKSLTAKHVV